MIDYEEDNEFDKDILLTYLEASKWMDRYIIVE